MSLFFMSILGSLVHVSLRLFFNPFTVFPFLIFNCVNRRADLPETGRTNKLLERVQLEHQNGQNPWQNNFASSSLNYESFIQPPWQCWNLSRNFARWLQLLEGNNCRGFQERTIMYVPWIMMLSHLSLMASHQERSA